PLLVGRELVMCAAAENDELLAVALLHARQAAAVQLAEPALFLGRKPAFWHLNNFASAQADEMRALLQRLRSAERLRRHAQRVAPEHLLWYDAEPDRHRRVKASRERCIGAVHVGRKAVRLCELLLEVRADRVGLLLDDRAGLLLLDRTLDL